MLITPSEAWEQYRAGRVLFLDVRTHEEYRTLHLPGAVNVDFFAHHWADTSPEGLREFHVKMSRLLSHVGLRENRAVVLYEDLSGINAARGIWILEYLGFRGSVAVLDGGLKEWSKVRLEAEGGEGKPLPFPFCPDPIGDLVASIDFIKEHLEDAGVVFVDARSREEYRGIRVRARRGGAIPGAVHVEWKRNLTPEGKFKIHEALGKIYLEEGVAPEKEIVTYCHGGYRSSHTYLALRLLGYPKVRNYLGSWAEWGNREDLPIMIPEK